jgi:D-alanyl-D-alanine dipeptidase
MPGLVPGIHVLQPFVTKKDVDGRDKPGHDDVKRQIDEFA